MKHLDKLWHFVGSFGLVVLIYGGLTMLRRHQWSFDVRLAMAVAGSFILGLAKELADLWSDDWPWCRETCHFDGIDLFVNVDAILAAAALIVVVKFACFRHNSAWDVHRTDATVVTLDDLDKDDEDDDICETETCNSGQSPGQVDTLPV